MFISLSHYVCMARQHSPDAPGAPNSRRRQSFADEEETPNPLPSRDYSHGESADEQDEVDDADSGYDA